MAVLSTRTYDTVTMPGASLTSRMLRGVYGQESTDTDLATSRLETFIAVESTGVADPQR